MWFHPGGPTHVFEFITRYVVGTSLIRLALPLYLYGCPANLLRIPPSPAIATGLVAFVAAQVFFGIERFRHCVLTMHRLEQC